MKKNEQCYCKVAIRDEEEIKAKKCLDCGKKFGN